jgi:hypothetical protein
MLNPFAKQMAIITMSINKLKKKTGIVIFVGIAARFTTTHAAMALMAKGQKIK